ncbi:hypothetical protein [Anaeromyxobacter oryzae]|uniref:hypothetical protein n=1 Tax=Anaeromyxobacter oryzae TaxID=2918170 RepID=UPI0020BF2A8B|nr:hypothetical protein [Anaeromyxobacter oryzae]
MNHACHPATGSVVDGGGCYLDAECGSGSCSAHGSGFTGQCCTSAGGSCESGAGAICCSGLVCFGEVDSPHACEACLDWTNSGPGKVACDPYGDCCPNQGLTCDPGTRGCFKQAGVACTDGAQCGPDHACRVPSGGTAATCCGELNAICYPASGAGCCDGFTCDYPGSGSYYTCRRSPGQACASPDECAVGDECLANRCCQHYGSCTTGAECCSGVCGADGQCACAPQYGECAKDGDCCGRAYARTFGFAGPVCGGAVSTGANTCCPTPGDACGSAADCCEAGDLCQVPATGTPAKPVCCRAKDSSCWSDEECCTGSCGGNPLRCCVQFGASCTADTDCCYGTGTYASQACSTTTHTCCLKAGQNPGIDATACCSGRLDPGGFCR